MSAPSGWQLPLLLSMFCVLAGLLMVLHASRTEQTVRRLRAVRRGAAPRTDIVSAPMPGWMRLVGALGGAVLRSGLLSRSAITELEQTVAAGGSSRAGPALALFVGAKLLAFLLLPLLGWVVLTIVHPRVPVPLLLAGCAIFGVLLPDLILHRVRKRYLKAVDLGLPAALDLLIICTEAGLSLEGALERVSVEARGAASATANELRITANEMKMLSDRRQALVNMGTRTELDAMTRLGTTLSQSLKYGTPLTQALRTLAAEMRQMALIRFEERAARIPVLLTIPMIVFILPCIFVVVGGPAAVRVVETLAHR
jgi:tight adherence protein C